MLIPKRHWATVRRMCPGPGGLLHSLRVYFLLTALGYTTTRKNDCERSMDWWARDPRVLLRSSRIFGAKAEAR